MIMNTRSSLLEISCVVRNHQAEYIYIYIYIYTHIYIYIYIQPLHTCNFSTESNRFELHTHIHTQLYIYIRV